MYAYTSHNTYIDHTRNTSKGRDNIACALTLSRVLLSLSRSLLLSTRQNGIGQSHLDHTRNAKERLNNDATRSVSLSVSHLHTLSYSPTLLLSPSLNATEMHKIG